MADDRLRRARLIAYMQRLRTLDDTLLAELADAIERYLNGEHDTLEAAVGPAMKGTKRPRWRMELAARACELKAQGYSSAQIGGLLGTDDERRLRREQREHVERHSGLTELELNELLDMLADPGQNEPG